MLAMSNVYRAGNIPLVALLRATCVGSVHHLQQDGHQRFESSIPRDKIFALLGLASDQEELGALGVIPDYKRSPEDVFAVTMAVLLQQNHVSLLSICRTSETRENLPSGVPDWSKPNQETLQDVEMDHLTVFPAFNASELERTCQATVSKEGRGPTRLSLRAAICDEICYVDEVIRIAATGTCMLPLCWLFELLRLTYSVEDIYEDFDDCLRTVIQISHAAIGYGENATLERVDRYPDALSLFKNALGSVGRKDMKRDLERFFLSTQGKKAQKRHLADPSRLIFDFMKIIQGRSPLITKNEHLGLIACYVRQGDVVVLIGGAQVPFVLQSSKGRGCELVSEAYVDVIMDREIAAGSRWQHVDLV